MRRSVLALMAAAVLAIAPIAARAAAGPQKIKPTVTELEAIESLERRQAEINTRSAQIFGEARERLKREGLLCEGWDASARAWSVTEIAPEVSGAATVSSTATEVSSTAISPKRTP